MTLMLRYADMEKWRIEEQYVGFAAAEETSTSVLADTIL
jgi:hypothetical protein